MAEYCVHTVVSKYFNGDTLRKNRVKVVVADHWSSLIVKLLQVFKMQFDKDSFPIGLARV
jgi:hypothetical protein